METKRELINVLKAGVEAKHELIKIESDGNLSSDKFKTYVKDCVTDVSKLSVKMQEIENQGGWKAYWNKGSNIKDLAQHLNLVGSVVQKNLELSVLLMNGAVNIKQDYTSIISILEETNREHSDQVEVVEALTRFRNMVNNLKKREDLLNDVADFTELHKQQINRIESELKIQYENLDNLKDSLSARIDKNSDIVSRYNSEFNEKIEFLNNKFSNHLSDIDSKWEKTVKELKIAYNRRFKNYNIALSILSVLIITILLVHIF